jgi:hypothetical protein
MFFWLCFVTLPLFAQEPRLYSGEIEVPTLGPLKMTLGISETDEGTVLLLTVPAQNAENIPLVTSYTKEGAISAELPQAGLSFVVFENEDQPATTGAVSEYGQIETTIEPQALSIMTDWIVEVTDNGC